METCNTRGQCSTSCSTVPATRSAQASVMTLGVFLETRFTGTANVVQVTLFDLNGINVFREVSFLHGLSIEPGPLQGAPLLNSITASFLPSPPLPAPFPQGF